MWKTALTIYHVLLRDPQTSKAISIISREIQAVTAHPTAFIVCYLFSVSLSFFFFLLSPSILTLPPLDRLTRWLVDFRCGATWFPASPEPLLLQFPSRSWIADTEFRISPNSSPIKPRKKLLQSITPLSSFRFRWKDVMQVRRGVKGAGVIWWMFFFLLFESAFLAHISGVYMILWSKVISAKTKQKGWKLQWNPPQRKKKNPQRCPMHGRNGFGETVGKLISQRLELCALR